MNGCNESEATNDRRISVCRPPVKIDPSKTGGLGAHSHWGSLNKRAISSLPGAEAGTGRPMVVRTGVSASFGPDFGPFTGFPRPASSAVKHCVLSESIYAASFSGVTCWTSSSRSGLRATV
jgi:hypothetical protein